MALQKDIELPSGIVATYHMIVDTNINWPTGSVDVKVFSYLDADARATKQQAYEWTIPLFNDQFPFTDDSSLRTQAYVALKGPGLLFEGAADC